MNQIDPTHTFNVGANVNAVYHASAGDGLPRHEHTYPHATVCHAGSIVVRKEGKEVVLTKASRPVLLPANEWHEIEVLADDTVFENVFAR